MSISVTLKKWIARLVKIAVVSSIVVFLLLFVMASLGGDSPALKQGLEQYLAQEFGGVAKIETFNGMTFYPYMSADAEGITVYESEKQEKALITAEKVKVSLGFWDMSIARGNIKALEIVNAKAASGVLTAQPLNIDRLGIETEGENPALTANGSYNGVPYQFQARMETIGAGKDQKYRFGNVRPFTFSIGSVRAEGQVERFGSDSIEVAEMDIDVNGSKVTGEMHYQLKKPGLRTIDFKAGLPHGTQVEGDLELESLGEGRTKITGDLVFDPLVHRDYFDTDIIEDIRAEIRELLGDKTSKDGGYDFSDTEMDLNVDVKSLQENGVSYFAVQFPLTIKGSVLKIGPYRSEFDGLKLDGETTLDSTQDPAVLNVEAHINDWAYGPVQRAFQGSESVTGTGDFSIKLNSKGRSVEELKSNMAGNFAFLGGEGSFPAKALNIWGGGLLNALLPDLSPEEQTNLNCAIADMSVENGIFKTNALFMDTQRVTLVGEGTYDLAADELDIQLTPKPKSVALGDISTAANMTGPISDPNVSPSVFSLGKKIGGLLLGGVNPALLAFTLADMNINESHPCGQFIKSGAENGGDLREQNDMPEFKVQEEVE